MSTSTEPGSRRVGHAQCCDLHRAWLAAAGRLSAPPTTKLGLHAHRSGELLHTLDARSMVRLTVSVHEGGMHHLPVFIGGGHPAGAHLQQTKRDRWAGGWPTRKQQHGRVCTFQHSNKLIVLCIPKKPSTVHSARGAELACGWPPKGALPPLAAAGGACLQWTQRRLGWKPSRLCRLAAQMLCGLWAGPKSQQHSPTGRSGVVRLLESPPYLFDRFCGRKVAFRALQNLWEAVSCIVDGATFEPWVRRL